MVYLLLGSGMAGTGPVSSSGSDFRSWSFGRSKEALRKSLSRHSTLIRNTCPADAPGNVDDDAEMQEVYTLLTENYVEDDALCLGERLFSLAVKKRPTVTRANPGPEDSMFRFDYSIHFLRWALKPPEFLRTA